MRPAPPQGCPRPLCSTGGLGSPLALYLTAASALSAWLTSMSSTRATSSARSSTPQRHRPQKDRLRRREALRLNPPSRSSSTRPCSPAPTPRHHQGLRHRRRRHRQLPTVTWSTTPACSSASQRLRLHLPLRGQASVFATKRPCYRCLYPSRRRPPVPSCAEGGVLGILPVS